MAVPPKTPQSPNYPPEQKSSFFVALVGIVLNLFPEKWVSADSKTGILAFCGTYVVSSQFSMAWLRGNRLKHGGQKSLLDRDGDGHTDLLPVAFLFVSFLAVAFLVALILVLVL